MLRLVPITLAEARRFIAEHHRHNDAPVGHRVSVGLSDGEKLVGVGVLSRPMARMSDDGRTAEVTRVATDGSRNACSMLYGALTRAAWALGYDRLITYTLPDEGGASLRASGWHEDAVIDHPAWKHTSGPRSADRPTLFYEAKMPVGKKVRWVKERSEPR
jgi:hypothetical protein